MLYKWVKDENCILVLYCSFFQDRLGPLAQHPNSKFYPSCCFRYSWSKPVFRDLKPSCFAYSTNYTQDLLARDKMNLETMEDAMPLLLYSYTTQTLALVSLVLLSNHPQDTISSLCDSAFLPPQSSPDIFPFLWLAQTVPSGRPQAVMDFLSHGAYQRTIKNIAPYVFLPPLVLPFTLISPQIPWTHYKTKLKNEGLRIYWG